ncbi:MAG: HigA family addiction module antidote protein [Prevotellaceae bacterium]|jgi:addiction module HigA family antidote|nr:HigA family addiction module antidote protein [Prevotellaceae bacterium]
MAKTTATELKSFRPYHPGELLKDELECRQLSQREFAKQIGLPYATFNEILNGQRPVTADVALYVEDVLGVPAYMLVGMQTDYDLTAQEDSKVNDRHAPIRKAAAVLQ